MVQQEHEKSNARAVRQVLATFAPASHRMNRGDSYGVAPTLAGLAAMHLQIGPPEGLEVRDFVLKFDFS